MLQNNEGLGIIFWALSQVAQALDLQDGEEEPHQQWQRIDEAAWSC